MSGSFKRMISRKKPSSEEDKDQKVRKRPTTSFRSLMTAASHLTNRHTRSIITGTLYGHRHGHVHLAFQGDPTKPGLALLLELATPTSVLVREMASGLVRITLECRRREPKRLVEETGWRAFCNGRKCGYAVRRDCGPFDRRVLKAVGPTSMGAGVLPKDEEGEVMYMRARFERVVGSKDSEAFYMMNPDGNCGTELSIYFLRV